MSPATPSTSKIFLSSSSSSPSRPATPPARYRHHQDRSNDAVVATISKSSPASRPCDFIGSSSFLFPTRSAEGSPQRRSCEWRRKQSEDTTSSNSNLAATKQFEISAPYDPKRGSRPLARNCHFSPPTTRPVKPERRIVVVRPGGGMEIDTGGSEARKERAPSETADADCHHRIERRGRASISGGSTSISRVRSEGCSPHSRKPERKPSIYHANQGLMPGERRRSSGLSAAWLAKNREQQHWDRRRGDGFHSLTNNAVSVTAPRPLPTSPPGHGPIPNEPLHSPRCKSPLCAPAAATRDTGRAAEVERTPARYRRKQDSKVSLPPVVNSKLCLPPPALSPRQMMKPDKEIKPTKVHTSPNAQRHSHEKPAPNGSCGPCTGGTRFPFGTMEESSRGQNLGSPAPEEKRRVAFMDGLTPPLEESSRMEEILRSASPEPETGLGSGMDEVNQSGTNSARLAQMSRKNSGGISWLKSFLLNPFGGKRSDGRDERPECSTEFANGERDTSEDDASRRKSSAPQYLPRCGSYSEEPGHMPARRSSMPARKESLVGGPSQTMPELSRRKSSAYVPTRRLCAMRPVLSSCQEDLNEAQAKRL